MPHRDVRNPAHRGMGHVVTFGRPFSCRYNARRGIVIGDIVIPTDDQRQDSEDCATGPPRTPPVRRRTARGPAKNVR